MYLYHKWWTEKRRDCIIKGWPMYINLSIPGSIKANMLEEHFGNTRLWWFFLVSFACCNSSRHDMLLLHFTTLNRGGPWWEHEFFCLIYSRADSNTITFDCIYVHGLIPQVKHHHHLHAWYNQTQLYNNDLAVFEGLYSK